MRPTCRRCHSAELEPTGRDTGHMECPNCGAVVASEDIDWLAGP